MMNNQRGLVLFRVLATLLVLSLSFAAWPQPARAAVTCDTYYIVNAGDTTVKIARKFDIKWKEIAEANNLKEPYELTVGQRLCIPAQKEEEESDDMPKYTLRIVATRTSITVTVSGLNFKKASFIVRARDARVGIGGWSQLGRLKAEKNDTTKKVFVLPKVFNGVRSLQVCLKEQTTDHLKCLTIVHP